MHRPETWPDNVEYQRENDFWGACNTGSKEQVICSLGGINCNVDHAFVMARNLNIAGGGLMIVNDTRIYPNWQRNPV